MKNYIQVLDILNKLRDKSAAREDLNTLIAFSLKISNAYLLRNYHKISKLYQYFHAEQDEVALDAIAGLFCIDKDGGNYNIINSLNSWQPPVTNEQQAFYFLNKIIASGVEQYISEMLRESDPVFSKIYNSVNYLVRKKGYSRIEFAGCKYIVKKEDEGLRSSFIDFDSFENIPSSCFMDKSDFLDEIFTYIASLESFAPAIPVNHLVVRLKKIYMNLPSESAHNIIEQKLAIDEAINLSMQETSQTLKEKYLQKGKLDESETGFFLLALNDMVYDLRDGGLNPGIHKYLERYYPALRSSEKYDIYHNILEYLLKMLKKSIADKLKVIKED